MSLLPAQLPQGMNLAKRYLYVQQFFDVHKYLRGKITVCRRRILDTIHTVILIKLHDSIAYTYGIISGKNFYMIPLTSMLVLVMNYSVEI